MLRYKLYKISSHIVGWLILMSLPLLFMPNESSDVLALITSRPYWFFCGLFLAIFYLFNYWLIPRLYLAGRHFYFLISFILVTNIVYFARPFDRLMTVRHSFDMPRQSRNDEPFERENPLTSREKRKMDFWNPPPGRPPGPEVGQRRMRIDIVSIFLYLLTVAMSMAITLMSKWRQTEKRAIEAEADRANAELSFLKAQINPHFLFNTLNNIYTLALIKSEHTPDSILKLSHIMRYLTEDSSKNFVPLADEINCISDYIDLQKLRLGKKSPVDFIIQGNAEGKVIAPLILITFIENTFKYGISKKDFSPVSIQLEITENVIYFTCTNHIGEKRMETESTGIGIKNTMQRLEHLYPSKHNLNINTENSLYTVNLTLQI